MPASRPWQNASASGVTGVGDVWVRGLKYAHECGTASGSPPPFIHFNGPCKGKLMERFQTWLRRRSACRNTGHACVPCRETGRGNCLPLESVGAAS